MEGTDNMVVHCDKCHEDYDDTYRDTFCPHDKFSMHTIMALGNETFVATTLEDMEAIRLYFTGVCTRRFAELQASQHVHAPSGLCLSRDISGRLVEAEHDSSVLLP